MNLMNLVVTVRSDCEGLSLPIFRKTILKTEVSVTDDVMTLLIELSY